jgi:hypothetical protein
MARSKSEHAQINTALIVYPLAVRLQDVCTYTGLMDSEVCIYCLIYYMLNHTLQCVETRLCGEIIFQYCKYLLKSHVSVINRTVVGEDTPRGVFCVSAVSMADSFTVAANYIRWAIGGRHARRMPALSRRMPLNMHTIPVP